VVGLRLKISGFFFLQFIKAPLLMKMVMTKMLKKLKNVIKMMIEDCSRWMRIKNIKIYYFLFLIKINQKI